MKKKRRQIDKRLKKKLPPAGHRVKKCEGGVEIQLRGLHCRASYAVITPICHDDGDDDDDLDDDDDDDDNDDYLDYDGDYLYKDNDDDHDDDLHDDGGDDDDGEWVDAATHSTHSRGFPDLSFSICPR